jgi:hypothetical protein
MRIVTSIDLQLAGLPAICTGDQIDELKKNIVL